MRNFMILGILSLAVLTLGACTGGGGGGAATLPPTGGTGNSAPVFTSTAPTAAVVGQLYSYQATASDANGDPLTWSLGIAPSGMSVNASGLVSWTPSAGQVGSHNVSLSANDGQASTAQSWTVNVSAAGGGNQPPVITSSAPTTATEGQLYSYQAAASDPNGDTLTWTLTTKPTGMTVGASTGLVQWTPSSSQVGNHSVTLQVSDGAVSASQSWTISVSAATSGGGTGNPTGGSGGAYPGNQSRNVTVSGLGTQTYYLYIPTTYTPGTAMPVMFAFHGAGGTGTAPAAAQAARNDWGSVAASNDFIVIAQAATGSGGGWLAGNDSAILNAIITDAFGAYNIDQDRIYAWGFSAGGHFLHALALQNADFFAAYSVNAGVLATLAGSGAPAAATRTIPVDIHIGTTDSLLPYAQQDKTAFQSAGWTLGTNLYYTEFSGGHTYTTTHLSQIWNNLKNHTLP